MTFDEIENSLPNGFHDAKISNLNIDYISREIIFEIKIWMGDISSPNIEKREAYRDAHLILSNFLYCVIEPPDPTYPYQESKTLCVGSGSIINDKIKGSEVLPSNLPNGVFCNWFFVNNWNAFIFVAAKKAQLKWEK